MEIKRTFFVSKRKQNRYFILGCEIERTFKIPKMQIMGLCRMKGIEEVDKIFRGILKSEGAENKAAVFLSLVAKLPIIYKPKRQLKLRLK